MGVAGEHYNVVRYKVSIRAWLRTVMNEKLTQDAIREGYKHWEEYTRLDYFNQWRDRVCTGFEPSFELSRTKCVKEFEAYEYSTENSSRKKQCCEKSSGVEAKVRLIDSIVIHCKMSTSITNWQHACSTRSLKGYDCNDGSTLGISPTAA